MGEVYPVNELLSANRPWDFWRLLPDAGAPQDWQAASREALPCLQGLPAMDAGNLADTLAAILGEEQFGGGHWQLSRAKRLYYGVRPFLPAGARPLLQRLAARGRKKGDLLQWPLEDRYVRFQFETVRRLLEARGVGSAPYVHFWPAGRQYALVLTHDVESARGQSFVAEVAAREESYGFRSSFNFVPEGYQVDRGLLADLQARGFEVGVHGLKHDGKLFSSLETFQARAPRINTYLQSWQAAGFRAPLTNRHPAWMQALDIDYDSSFFDTDPFEPIPGGTMSIWPFMLGRFVELPYTLPQDHTLLRTLGETTPRVWLEKAAFIRQHCGMVLINSHPDYLLNPSYLAVYDQFLAELRRQGGYWQALPGEVARWWRQRASAGVLQEAGGGLTIPDLPQATIGRVSLATEGQDRHGLSVQGLILEPEVEPVSIMGGI